MMHHSARSPVVVSLMSMPIAYTCKNDLNKQIRPSNAVIVSDRSRKSASDLLHVRLARMYAAIAIRYTEDRTGDTLKSKTINVHTSHARRASCAEAELPPLAPFTSPLLPID